MFATKRIPSRPSGLRSSGRSPVHLAKLDGLIAYLRALVFAAVVVLPLAGCAEKRSCFFACYEHGLKGYSNDCGYIENVTESECAAMRCGATRDARTSWGPLPDWCNKDPRSSRR